MSPALLILLASVPLAEAEATAPLTMADVLAASSAADWRQPAPENTLYLELDSGRVVIELAPGYAPAHVDNIRAFARAGYFDGLSINRVQDGFVVQWGDADGQRPLPEERGALAPEFSRAIEGASRFVALPDRDGYAPEVGFVDGFPAARDRSAGQTWLSHCYGSVGVGRDNPVDSGSGAQLYAVIGHAPRQLDRNITVVGRVILGIEHLTVLPRGSGALGFYQGEERRVPIRRLRLAAEVPEAERSRIELLRTDTETFEKLIESRRNRRDAWYHRPAGHIDLCSVPLPVRLIEPPAGD